MEGLRLERRLYQLLVDDKYTDCAFIVGKRVFNCHKLILAASSPVFEAMLYRPLKCDNEIRIIDCDSKSFDQMIEYIYTDKIDDLEKCDLENLLKLYYCADKYLIEGLVQLCVKQIADCLRYSNILKTMDMAVHNGFAKVENICIDFLKFSLTNCNNLDLILRLNGYELSTESTRRILRILKELGGGYQNVFNENLIDFTDDDLNMIISSNVAPNSPVSCFRCICLAIKFLKVGESQFTTLTISCDRFWALDALIINSRFQPYGIDSKTYMEQLTLQIKLKDSSELSVNKRFDIENVQYNDTLTLKLDEPLAISQNAICEIKIIWDEDVNGAEYPQSIYKSIEQNHKNTFKFDEELRLFNTGSIIMGFKYIPWNRISN